MASTLKALVFDFDGVILETEETVFQTWLDLYRSFGCDLTMEYWGTIIGMPPDAHADPFDGLEAQLGHPVDRKTLGAARRQRELDILTTHPAMPGIETLLREAHAKGLKLGIASSSSIGWVDVHLQRLGLLAYFDDLSTRDRARHGKPDPELYLRSVQALGVAPSEAVAFEDSTNGIRAAVAAGLFCIAVPTKMTRDLPMGEAHLVLPSLEGVTVAALREYHRQWQAGVINLPLP